VNIEQYKNVKKQLHNVT